MKTLGILFVNLLTFADAFNRTLNKRDGLDLETMVTRGRSAMAQLRATLDYNNHRDLDIARIGGTDCTTWEIQDIQPQQPRNGAPNTPRQPGYRELNDAVGTTQPDLRLFQLVHQMYGNRNQALILDDSTTQFSPAWYEINARTPPGANAAQRQGYYRNIFSPFNGAIIAADNVRLPEPYRQGEEARRDLRWHDYIRREWATALARTGADAYPASSSGLQVIVQARITNDATRSVISIIQEVLFQQGNPVWPIEIRPDGPGNQPKYFNALVGSPNGIGIPNLLRFYRDYFRGTNPRSKTITRISIAEANQMLVEGFDPTSDEVLEENFEYYLFFWIG